MSLNAVEIASVTKILNTSLENAVVRKVLSEKARNRLILELWGNHESHYLRICLDAEFCRIGRIREPPLRAETPHPFVMLLRRELTGRRILLSETIGNDRVVRLVFHPDFAKAELICELTSRHANAFLVMTDGTIAGSFFPNRSSLRKLNPGEPYVAPFPHPTMESTNRFVDSESLEDDIEAFYQSRESQAALEALRRFVMGRISSIRKKTEKLRHALLEDLAKAKQGESLATYGHVLKANLMAVKKGQTQFRTQDFEGRAIILPLDPTLGPVENMNHLFERSKRLIRAVASIETRIFAAEKTIAELTDKEDAARSGTVETLHILESSLGRSPSGPNEIVKSQQRNPQRRWPFREFTIHSGRPARVGRSAKENDELTLKYAKPDDLWLHVRNTTGSHVVVPMGRKEIPHPDLLIDAAHLAVHFSSLKGQTDVEVLYTQRRYVQKQKGSAPGAVRLLKEKCIALRVEEERLKRILRKESSFQSSK